MLNINKNYLPKLLPVIFRIWFNLEEIIAQNCVLFVSSISESYAKDDIKDSLNVTGIRFIPHMQIPEKYE